MCEPKRINRFSLRQNLRLLLTFFESKPYIIIIFHLKTNRQKLEKYHVNGSQARRAAFQNIYYSHYVVLKLLKSLRAIKNSNVEYINWHFESLLKAITLIRFKKKK